jgi:hypothetical protein
MRAGPIVAMLPLVAALGSAPALAESQTDFGVRAVGQIPDNGGLVVEPVAGDSPVAHFDRSPVDLATAARIGAQWGTVTSTRRSLAHNRAVGGVRNSYHLSDRAIDIARRAGVRHADIAAALRRAGFHLIESLDEGDHSHFAFGGGVTVFRQAGSQVRGHGEGVRSASVSRESDRTWRIVTAPGGGHQ